MPNDLRHNFLRRFLKILSMNNFLNTQGHRLRCGKKGTIITENPVNVNKYV